MSYEVSSHREPSQEGAPSCARLAWYDKVRVKCARATSKWFDQFICEFAHEFAIDRHLRDACFAGAFKGKNIAVAHLIVDCAMIICGSINRQRDHAVSRGAYAALVRERAYGSDMGRTREVISQHIILNVAYFIFENIAIDTFGTSIAFVLRDITQNQNFNANMCLSRALRGGIAANVKYLVSDQDIARLLTKGNIDLARTYLRASTP